jgi:tRNA pseudouridine55 synthase
MALSFHGALLVDKPYGPTSHDIVAFARRALRTTRVGHTGTLDPLATGLLVLLIGHATRLSQFLVTDEKEYIADIRLGIATPTYDAQGIEAGVASREARQDVNVTTPQVENALRSFLGTFPQLPPPFSAKKVDGVRAYRMARKNEPVKLKAVQVTVRELEIVPAPPVAPRGSDSSLLRVRIVCSSGFYVRSLAQDVGQLLGCGAHLEALRRTRAGQFRLEDALTLDVVEAAGRGLEERLIGLNTLLAGLPAVSLTDEGLRRAANGNTLSPAHLQSAVPPGPAGGRMRVLDPSGELLSVAESRPDGLLHPLLVLR